MTSFQRVLVVLLPFILTGCASLQITGRIVTPYGSVQSDGKTILLEARTGFAK